MSIGVYDVRVVCCVSDSLAMRLDSLPQADIPERRVLVVELEKVPEYGIGITIVGGENTGKLDLGVFVRSVTPGGPADLDGRVRPGDRIIAVNGQSLEGMPHHVAVELIRDSPSMVQLMLSQNTVPLPTTPLSRESTPSLDEVNVEENLYPAQPQHDEHGAEDQPMEETGPFNITNIARPPSSIASSDLELEDVVPQQALYPKARKSKTPDGRRSSTPIQDLNESGTRNTPARPDLQPEGMSVCLH